MGLLCPPDVEVKVLESGRGSFKLSSMCEQGSEVDMKALLTCNSSTKEAVIFMMGKTPLCFGSFDGSLLRLRGIGNYTA